MKAYLPMPTRNIGISFTIDANRINARQNDLLMNRLEQWHKDEVIDIIISEPAAEEVKAGGHPSRFSKLHSYFQTQTLAETRDEIVKLRKISEILYGRAPIDKNEANDVKILFNVVKYAGFLITEDGQSKTQREGILGHRGKLKKLGIEVYRTHEAVALVEKRIKHRDLRARIIAEEQNLGLPEWVGQD